MRINLDMKFDGHDNLTVMVYRNDWLYGLYDAHRCGDGTFTLTVRNNMDSDSNVEAFQYECDSVEAMTKELDEWLHNDVNCIKGNAKNTTVDASDPSCVRIYVDLTDD